MKILVFWQNIPSIHQASLIRAIACIWPGKVLVVTESGLSEDRLEQGWYMPDFSPAQLIVSPGRQERDDIANTTDSSDCVHVFSGFHAYPQTYQTFKRLVRTAATIGVFAEAGQTGDGLWWVLRKFRYFSHAIRWRRDLDFLLAAGELGVRWYQGVSFPTSAIYPFGYFIGAQCQEFQNLTHERLTDRQRDEVRFLFVGQLIARKNIELMIRALAFSKMKPWHLDIVGCGPLRNACQKLAFDLGVSECIHWLGVEGNSSVRARMAHADVLILPSRFDGWGVVINEAIMAGTRVIVSDTCGAADLVAQTWLGTVFHSGSIKSLMAAVSAEMIKGPLTVAWRTRISSWALNCIDPDVVAHYFLDIVSHVCHEGVRPLPTWKK